jgi:hypothetical protein
MQARDGRWLEGAGLVLVRQMPGSAKGVMFITIEDESGIANLVVWPRIFETQRRIILAAGMLAVYGPIQREGDVVHLVAHRLKALGKHRAPPGAPAPAPRPPPRPTIRKDPHPARGYGQNWPPECRCYRPHARLPPGLPGPRNIPAAEIPGTGELLGCPAPLVRRPWIRFQRWRAWEALRPENAQVTLLRRRRVMRVVSTAPVSDQPE